MNYRHWWMNLSPAWQMAFNEVVLQRGGITDLPSDESLELIHSLTVLRFAGPGAFFPNMRFELSDMSGLSALKNLEILVVVNHQLKSLNEIGGLTNLKSLFVNNNQIENLDGIEQLAGNLQEFYFNVNQVQSLLPLQNFEKLHTLYCNLNQIKSLEGIGEQHTLLEKFYCIPNEGLSQREILRFEREIGIRCLKG